MEKSNVFLDTNIIIDILCMRDGYEAAASVLQMGMNGEVKLFMTNPTLSAVPLRANLIVGFSFL